MVPSGRLAEIVGDVGIPLDKYARILSKKLLFEKGTKQTLGRMHQRENVSLDFDF